MSALRYAYGFLLLKVEQTYAAPAVILGFLKVGVLKAVEG